MRKIIYDINKFYSTRTKIYFLLTVISTIIYSISELLSISILIPIINFLIYPSNLLKYEFFSQLFLKYGVSGELQIRHFILLTAFCSIILNAIIKNLLFKFNTNFAAHIGIQTSNLLVCKILDVNYVFLKNINVDSYITLIGKNIEYFTYYIVLPFINLLSSTFQIILLMGLLFYINFKISVITFVFFVSIYSLINYFNRKKLSHISSIISSASPKTIEGIRNVIYGFREIFLYSKNDYYKSNFHNVFYGSFRAQSKSLYFAALPKFILESIAIFFILFILYYKIIEGDNFITIIPFLTTFVLTLQRILPSFQLAFGSYTSIKTYSYLFNEIFNNFDQLDSNKLIFSKDIKDQILAFENINFQNINFNYPGKQNIFDNFNFQINAGDKVFIYGRSGAGKSTFIDLFCGFLPQNSGSIKINDEFALNDVLYKWKDQIAYIPQKVHLLNGSFYENITYSHVIDNNIDKVRKYAQLCGIDDLIMSNDLGYNFKINPDINNLSGGQVKRLCIARAMYFDKSIIILDEATSGLDSQSEFDIVNMLLQVCKDKTILYISHNLEYKKYFNKELFF